MTGLAYYLSITKLYAEGWKRQVKRNGDFGGSAIEETITTLEVRREFAKCKIAELRHEILRIVESKKEESAWKAGLY